MKPIFPVFLEARLLALLAGMTLFVFDDGEKIGELEVVDVVNEHFSSCKVINSTAEIKKGNKVKARVVKKITEAKK